MKQALLSCAWVSLVVGLAGGLAGCKEEPAKLAPAPAVSAASAPLAAGSAPAASASAPAAPANSASTAPSGRPHPDTCEVEIFGTVALPKDGPKDAKYVAYVAQNDCLADDAQMLGHVEVGASGSIVIEVFPKWGSDITVCAARDAGDGKPTALYGRAKGTFHAEAEGEVTFNEVKIGLAPGKPHVFPKDASGAPPSKTPTAKAAAPSAANGPAPSAANGPAPSAANGPAPAAPNKP